MSLPLEGDTSRSRRTRRTAEDSEAEESSSESRPRGRGRERAKEREATREREREATREKISSSSSSSSSSTIPEVPVETHKPASKRKLSILGAFSFSSKSKLRSPDHLEPHSSSSSSSSTASVSPRKGSALESLESTTAPSLSSNADEVAELQKKLLDQEKANRKLERELRRTKRHLEESQDDLQAKEELQKTTRMFDRQLKLLKTNLQEAGEQIVLLQQQRDNLQTTMRSDMEEMQQRHLNEKMKLERKVQLQEQELQQEKDELREAEQQIARLQRQVDDQKRNERELQSSLQLLESQTDRQLQSLKQQLERVTLQLTECAPSASSSPENSVKNSPLSPRVMESDKEKQLQLACQRLEVQLETEKKRTKREIDRQTESIRDELLCLQSQYENSQRLKERALSDLLSAQEETKHFQHIAEEAVVQQNSLSQQIEDLRSQLSRQNSIHDSLQDTIVSLKSHINSNNHSQESLKLQFDIVSRAKSKMEEDQRQMQTVIERQNQQIKSLEEEGERAKELRQQQVQQLEARLAESERVRMEAEKLSLKLTYEHKEATEELQERRQQGSTFSDQLRQREDEIKRLNTIVDRDKNKIEALTNENAAFKLKELEMTRELKSLARRGAWDLQHIEDEYISRIRKLESQIKSIVQENDSNERTIDQLQDEMRAVSERSRTSERNRRFLQLLLDETLEAQQNSTVRVLSEIDSVIDSLEARFDMEAARRNQFRKLRDELSATQTNSKGVSISPHIDVHVSAATSSNHLNGDPSSPSLSSSPVGSSDEDGSVLLRVANISPQKTRPRRNSSPQPLVRVNLPLPVSPLSLPSEPRVLAD